MPRRSKRLGNIVYSKGKVLSRSVVTSTQLNNLINSVSNINFDSAMSLARKSSQYTMAFKGVSKFFYQLYKHVDKDVLCELLLLIKHIADNDKLIDIEITDFTFTQYLLFISIIVGYTKWMNLLYCKQKYAIITRELNKMLKILHTHLNIKKYYCQMTLFMDCKYYNYMDWTIEKTETLSIENLEHEKIDDDILTYWMNIINRTFMPYKQQMNLYIDYMVGHPDEETYCKSINELTKLSTVVDTKCEEIYGEYMYAVIMDKVRHGEVLPIVNQTIGYIQSIEYEIKFLGSFSLHRGTVKYRNISWCTCHDFILSRLTEYINSQSSSIEN